MSDIEISENEEYFDEKAAYFCTVRSGRQREVELVVEAEVEAEAEKKEYEDEDGVEAEADQVWPMCYWCIESGVDKDRGSSARSWNFD